MPLLTCTKLDCADSPPVAAKKVRKGATMMEYLMMISLIIVVCLIAIGFLGTSNNTNMSSSSNSITKFLKKGS